jgi:hypothetical protein
MAVLSEEYKVCVATAAETTKKFRAALEKKQSEGVDTKDLEVRMKKIVDNADEGCAKIASADAKIASADAKIASADAKSIELEKIRKTGLEINVELQSLEQVILEYSNQKITAEQFRLKTVQAPQLVEKIKIHMTHAKTVIQDPKILSVYEGYEPNLQKILQYIATVSGAKTVKK